MIIMEDGKKVCYLFSPVEKEKWIFGLDLRKLIILSASVLMSAPFFGFGLLAGFLTLVVFVLIGVFIAFFEIEGLTLERFLLSWWKYSTSPHFYKQRYVKPYITDIFDIEDAEVFRNV